MRFLLSTAILGMALATPALTQPAPDPAVGESEFRKCKACHMIRDDAGNMIVRGGTVGPNLWGIISRPIASVEGFAYGDSLSSLAASQPDLIWTREELAAYVADPRVWLQDKTGDSTVRSKMTFKLTRNQPDMAAYLASFPASAD